MNQLEDILKKFEQIDYLSVKEGFLLNRCDKKYLVNKDSLNKILEDLEDDYRLMTVEGVIHNHYITEYFDTPDFAMYLMHHNGKKNRYKIRNRTYASTNVTFSEFKEKNNKSVTHKSRHIKGNTRDETDFLSLIPDKYKNDKTIFESKMSIHYNRITLVGIKTRITIDQDLTFIKDQVTKKLSNTAIVEFKYENPSEWRAFNRLMLDQKVRTTSLSKYCVGINYLYNIKSNNFKKILRLINKIEYN